MRTELVFLDGDSGPPDVEPGSFSPAPPYPERLVHNGQTFVYDHWELAWANGSRRTKVFYRARGRAEA
ncbi:MAG TPA: hypothetical protein VJ689_12735 [Gaiellaceae bacterium]|nr:hypothetical protein [Gaiellaceae bacterium]